MGIAVAVLRIELPHPLGDLPAQEIDRERRVAKRSSFRMGGLSFRGLDTVPCARACDRQEYIKDTGILPSPPPLAKAPVQLQRIPALQFPGCFDPQDLEISGHGRAHVGEIDQPVKAVAGAAAGVHPAGRSNFPMGILPVPEVSGESQFWS
jgi:hypothetical protein